MRRFRGDVPAPFLMSFHDQPITDDEVARTAQTMHESICVERGEVFKAHLFASRQEADRLLLVAHHLAVDAVSWRIILSDLVDLYADQGGGSRPRTRYTPTAFADWVRHVQSRAPSLVRRYRSQIGGGIGAPPPASTFLEADAMTAWLAFSQEETTALEDVHFSTATRPLNPAVLAALLHVLAETTDTSTFDVEVESHGRATFADGIDVSGVVGWFTSTYKLPLSVGEDFDESVVSVGKTLAGVPDLGMGYLLDTTAGQLDRPAPICYNFLGRFQFDQDHRLHLAPSRTLPGSARGARNNRPHELTLTARIVHDQLVIDLIFHPDRLASTAAIGALAAMHSLMLDQPGKVSDKVTQRCLVTTGSSAGMLMNVPPMVQMSSGTRLSPQSGRRGYRELLLTGGTGFLGAHLLKEILTKTTSTVHCLVRAPSNEGADRRLREAYDWYFPDEPLSRWPDRVVTHCGDAARADFGMPTADFDLLTGSVSAVYHLAADTRLVGEDADFILSNVESVRAVIRFARVGRRKDVHFVSTLAVAGTGPAHGCRRFSECELDIGQSFQNAYEQSKYRGEKLITEFVADGGRGYCYRTGTVTGHSLTGRFRREPVDSRVIQLLRAIVRTGRRPRSLDERERMSPVDVVADAILAISTCDWIYGGTFHIESSDDVSYGRFVDAIELYGKPLAPSLASNVAELLSTYPDRNDPAVQLGLFWATRPHRNVWFDNSRTTKLLGDLGVVFGMLDQDWVRAHVAHLVEQQVFDDVGPAVAVRSAEL